MAQLVPEDDSDPRPRPAEAEAHDSVRDTDPAAAFRSPAHDQPDATDERDIWTGRTSWKHFAPRLFLWLFGNIAAATAFAWLAGKAEGFESKYLFWTVAAMVVVSGLAIPGRVALRVLSEQYRLTSQRLFITRGILSQTIDQTELIRIDDVRIRQTLVDRLFGLGTVTVVSTDATDHETAIEGVAGAEGIAEAIRSHIRAMRSKSLYIESL